MYRRVAHRWSHRRRQAARTGGKDDAATRLENRLGEPAANPYLYIASQIVCGLDGMERRLKPGARDDEPYSAERPLLPTGLGQALDALEASALFRRQLGDVFIDYMLMMKKSEVARFLSEVTDWEQREYFEFF